MLDSSRRSWPGEAGMWREKIKPGGRALGRVHSLETGRGMAVSVLGYYAWNRAWWEVSLGSGQWSTWPSTVWNMDGWRDGKGLEAGDQGED